MRVLPLGDGLYQRFWGATDVRHTGPGTASNSPKTVGGWKRWIKNEVKGEGLSSSLFSDDDPPLPTGAGGRGNPSYHVHKVRRTIPVAAGNILQKTPIGLLQ